MRLLEILWLEIDRLLVTLDGLEGVVKVRARMKQVSDLRQHNMKRLSNTPRCGFLDEALGAVDAPLALRLAQAIGQADLYWESYDAYASDTIGPHFPRRHAYASLIADVDPTWARDIDVGFLLIAPNTLYRDHHHPASELYVPLTGPSRWRFGTDQSWITRQAGEAVWNPPNQVHATWVGDVPLLCLYVWTEGVLLPASVDFSADWKEIEEKQNR